MGLVHQEPPQAGRVLVLRKGTGTRISWWLAESTMARAAVSAIALAQYVQASQIIGSAVAQLHTDPVFRGDLRAAALK